MLSGGAFLISVISFFYFRTYLRRRTGQERILSEFSEEVDKILKAFDLTTDRDISLIEERERALKSILEETDKRLNFYIRELEKGRKAEDAYAALQQKNTAAYTGQISPSYQELGRNRFRQNKPDAPPPESSDEGANAGVSGEISEPVINTDAGINSSAASATGEAPPEYAGDSVPAFPLRDINVKAEPPKSSQIRDFLRAGLSPQIIASRLGISIAEVEFAAALLERRES